MAKYFNYFPKTLYSTDSKSNALDTVTNLIARFSFEQKLKDNSSVFYFYDIKEGDTPEIIARKFYENVERHWIVLLFNDIVDPQFDWPLDSRTLNEYINNKYSSPSYADTANTSVSGLSWAKSLSNVHSYYKVITETTFDKIDVQKLEVDSITYANNTLMQNGTNQNFLLGDGTSVNIKITKETKTYFDYELEENENKRKIKLLKPEFVSEVEKEFKRVVKL
jgi:hypothetical protein